MSVIATSMSIWHKLSHLGEGTSPKKMPVPRLAYRQARGAFSWLMIDVRGPAHCGQCYLWAVGSGCYKKAGWASHEEQGSKQHSSVHGLGLSSVSFLASLDDRLQVVRQYKPFSQVAMVFGHSNLNEGSETMRPPWQPCSPIPIAMLCVDCLDFRSSKLTFI